MTTFLVGELTTQISVVEEESSVRSLSGALDAREVQVITASDFNRQSCIERCSKVALFLMLCGASMLLFGAIFQNWGVAGGGGGLMVTACVANCWLGCRR